MAGAATGGLLCEISAAMPRDVAPARMRTGIKKTNMPPLLSRGAESVNAFELGA
jgi:hypothetical protein